ncbi:glycosyltransferase family 9 protein [Leucobacter chromiiresistens]|uniref:ADP-heptose:LPS heptosyltransferase n=1 Tax=Leucobacter chromiiresistens TaxID=1079994 RepID=A0A1H0ZBP2_9MICO|nr:glycosyltransferase family 9 protein [Leucobacter chromiiresistens]SDQ24905.1 ADP-heptose:LPS heptosyltransferase [Leucobacter chromiiresistens]
MTRRHRPVLLALRTLKLGDLLVAVPALRALRRAYPDHRIVLAAPGWLSPIVRLVDAVDELLPTPGLDDPLPLEPGSVDIAVNLHGNGPESRDVIAALEPRRRFAHRLPDDPEPAPGAVVEPGPEWIDGMLERERWVRLVSAFGAEGDPDEVRIAVPEAVPPVTGAVVVHVGAFYGSRQWPVERFAEVARALRDEGRRVVVTGDERDEPRAAAVASAAGLPEEDVLAGRIGLAEFAAVIARAQLVVTADTGAGHLASAYGVPSVVIFGPAPPEEWGPPPGPHAVLTDASVRRGEAFAADPDPALLAVTAEEVLAAARAVMRAPAEVARPR